METVTDISTGWIKAAIQDFISTSPTNSMGNKSQGPHQGLRRKL